MANRIRNTQWICTVILILLTTGCVTSAPVKISIETTLIPKEAALNYLKTITVTSEHDCNFSDKTITYLGAANGKKSELKYSDAKFSVFKLALESSRITSGKTTTKGSFPIIGRAFNTA